MKKLLTLLLAAALALSLAACGGGKSGALKNSGGVENSKTEEDGDEIIEVYDEPIVLLDSGDVKIVATSKLSKREPHTVNENGDPLVKLGYAVEIENNSDKYVMINTVDEDMDGFMLDDGPYMDIRTVAPGKKAKTLLYFKAGETNSVEINSIEDVHDLDGNWQIMYSENGSSYSTSDTEHYPFENILP